MLLLRALTKTKTNSQMLMHMVQDGYRIAHIGDQNKHGATEWDTALSPMEEVRRPSRGGRQMGGGTVQAVR
jgi:hypothetical protein